MNLGTFLRERSRGNPATLARYEKAIQRFRGWLGSRTLSLEAVHEYEDWLGKKYSQNSRIPETVAVNLYLAHVKSEYRLRSPTKYVNPNPKHVEPGEYAAGLERAKDPEHRVLLMLERESVLLPREIVTLRLSELDAHGERFIIRKLRAKTGAQIASVLTPETSAVIREYVASRGLTDYIFPATSRATKKPHRERTWPAKVHAKLGLTFTPRAFRGTGATDWSDDMPSLMLQGGWKDPKTVLTYYRRDKLDRHIQAHDRAMGRGRVQKPPIPGSMEKAGGEGSTPPPSPSHRSRSPEVF